MDQMASGESERPRTKDDAERRRPAGAVAAALARRIARDGAPLIYVAENGRRRRELFQLTARLAGDGAACEFEAPDGFPGDGLPVSAATAGNRMGTLRWLLTAKTPPRVLFATPAALIRKLPPRETIRNACLEIEVGEAIDEAALDGALRRLGYRLDDRVDEPGEAAFRGRVIEIFPAGAPRPCRIEHDEERVTAIRSYDPASQRSVAATKHLIVEAASETAMADREADDDGEEEKDDEAGPDFLCRSYDDLETIFDILPKADVTVEDGADLLADEFFGALDRLAGDEAHGHAIRMDHLSRDEWEERTAERTVPTPLEDGDEAEAALTVPNFALEEKPYDAFAAFAGPLREKGCRIVLAGPKGRALRSAARKAAKALDTKPVDAVDFAGIERSDASDLVVFEAPVTESFVTVEGDILVVALAGLAGQGAAAARRTTANGFEPRIETFLTGDKVVHIEHGVAILKGLEEISTPDEDGAPDGERPVREALSLAFKDEETLLVPFEDIGAIWRYGGASSDVSLDRLKGGDWARRRDAIFEAVNESAGEMVARLKKKEKTKGAKLRPDRTAFERSCARFAYDLTPDQEAATAAVLKDLASGRAMDRLVCGDVGYGKTEVAMRATAAAVFSGRQVAVVAPTTILAQQHYRAFKERFSPQGVEVVRFSRLVDAKETKAARKALEGGEARIAVGTHAILSNDIAFDDLALVVIDEEQRFGSEAKAAMRGLADDIHVLKMTATPIPRTLGSAFVGLGDLSVIATPPTRRSPVATTVGPFDDETVAEALAVEHARGGQSFVVCPRIDDLEEMEKRLGALAPDQSVVTLHGKMKPDEVEDAMLAFSAGEGDILLSTTIVESGLDIANANTMVVTNADRFGLAELHQLRGRVGRGTRRGRVLLTTPEDGELGEDARKRLAALQEFDTLGAGFDIAVRDLDLRGTGELLGDEQAGHVQTIGIGLYRAILQSALARIRDDGDGKTGGNEARPDVSIGVPVGIPADYVDEPDMRIEIALMLERIGTADDLADLKEEIEDRFGPVPPALATNFAVAQLRLRCRDLGVLSLDAGPKASALSFDEATRKRLKQDDALKKADGVRWSKERLVFEADGEAGEPIAAAGAILDKLAALLEAGRTR